MNNLENAEHYFKKLLNKEIDVHSKINLSSAQQARAYGWLLSNKYLFKDDLLSVSFSLSELLNDANPSTAVESHVPKSRSIVTTGNFQKDFENISSVGIDIQKISELFSDEMLVDPKNSNELTKIFTMRELSYGQSQNNLKETLAGIFAAKEAIQKAGLHATPLNEIEILPNASGAPQSNTHAVSISHSGDFAIAVAIPKNLNRPIKGVEPSNVYEVQKPKLTIFSQKKYIGLFTFFFIIALLIYCKLELV